MNNTTRKTQYGIKIDFEKSHGSYLHDKITNKEYLDFFGMYATLALGYNHPIFNSEDFKNRMLRIASCKIVNNEILSDEAQSFDKTFTDYVSLDGKFSHFHYSCTGALAIEAAVKTAIDYKGFVNPKIISFKESFHGINGYGGGFTARIGGAGERLKGFPGPFSWPQFKNPIMTYEKGVLKSNNEDVISILNKVEDFIKLENSQISGILLEPIQCTFGDKYFSETFFIGLRKIADKYDIPLIFDEIQVGFGGTGKIWYFEHLPIEPDIVVFGKKVQLAGIMVKEKFTKVFSKPIRLEVTWDSNIVDMLRGEFIVKAYKEYNILDNVNAMSIRLRKGLEETKNLINIRNTGLLFAFDFESENLRNKFVNQLFINKMLCNKSANKTVRFRPNLSVSSYEVDKALEIIKKVDNSL
jgi:L-lysine 6-transaminase